MATLSRLPLFFHIIPLSLCIPSSLPSPLIPFPILGPLFGLIPGLVIVSLVATTGSSICYTLSKTLGGALVRSRFPTLLDTFRQKVQSHRDNLFFYFLFLRISPILPNWFISVASPLINVPLHIFASATFLGLMPGNYFHVTTGMTLHSLTSVSYKCYKGHCLLSIISYYYMVIIYAYQHSIPTTD